MNSNDYITASGISPSDESQCSEQSLLFAELCDDFSRRNLAGEDPSVAEYIELYPELRDEIEAVFPALAAVDQINVQETALAKDNRAAPSKIGAFEIVRRLGTGGMGVVYEAIHPTVSRRIAIKVLRQSKQHDASLQERFLREAEAA